MIHRTLFRATVMAAGVAVTACSDLTAPQTAAPGLHPAAGVVAAAPDAVRHATVVATIRGRGTSEMQDPLAAGKTLFWTDVGKEKASAIRLLSDGSATGRFTCVDVLGDWPGFPGDIHGDVTSWSMEGSVVVLNIVGTVTPFNPDGTRGATEPVSFVVKIQTFGGAGVGRWTLQIGDFIYCYELVTSGSLVYRAHDSSADDDES